MTEERIGGETRLGLINIILNRDGPSLRAELGRAVGASRVEAAVAALSQAPAPAPASPPQGPLDLLLGGSGIASPSSEYISLSISASPDALRSSFFNLPPLLASPSHWPPSVRFPLRNLSISGPCPPPLRPHVLAPPSPSPPRRPRLSDDNDTSARPPNAPPAPPSRSPLCVRHAAHLSPLRPPRALCARPPSFPPFV